MALRPLQVTRKKGCAMYRNESYRQSLFFLKMRFHRSSRLLTVISLLRRESRQMASPSRHATLGGQYTWLHCKLGFACDAAIAFAYTEGIRSIPSLSGLPTCLKLPGLAITQHHSFYKMPYRCLNLLVHLRANKTACSLYILK